MTGGGSESKIIAKVPQKELVRKAEPVKVAEPVKKENIIVKTETKKVNLPKEKKSEVKKPAKKVNKVKNVIPKKPVKGNVKGKKAVSFVPVLEVPMPTEELKDIPLVPVLDQRKMDVVQVGAGDDDTANKKTIRRSGLEIKKAEELQEKKRIAQEKEWEIPAFLRKVKFK